jgi:hypothetical protein
MEEFPPMDSAVGTTFMRIRNAELTRVLHLVVKLEAEAKFLKRKLLPE